MNITQLVVKKEIDKLDKEVRKLNLQPEFRKNLDVIKQYIAQGYSLDEARLNLPKMTDNKWKAYLHALGSFTYSPGKIFTEYYMRSKVRMSMLIDAYNMAKKQGDIRALTTAVMTMTKLDESLVAWAQALGVIKPEEKTIDGGIGIDDADLRNEFIKLEQEITYRIQLQGRARRTISATLLNGSESERQSDSMGPSTVDDKTSR